MMVSLTLNLASFANASLGVAMKVLCHVVHLQLAALN